MEDEGYFLKDWNKAAYRIPPFSLSRHFTFDLALELDLTKAGERTFFLQDEDSVAYIIQTWIWMTSLSQTSLKT